MEQPVTRKRLQLDVQGVVQGVGFRPFVYHLATQLGLGGWVHNHSQGVTIEIEGSDVLVNQFLKQFQSTLPSHARIQNLDLKVLPLRYDRQFEIRSSQTGLKTALMLPDLAICPDCRQELFTPTDRRYRYPFITCTHCGPRYSMIEGLPYDREKTTMARFPLCDRCQAEYTNPNDRRFHAEPIACPDCSPQLAYWNAQGETIATQEAALQCAVTAIAQGDIVAVKGLGGFHLIVDAHNTAAIERLRQRKQRPTKPFAVMYPRLAMIQADCQISDREIKLLTSAAAPIVLLTRKPTAPLSARVAPGNPYLGVMLPYTPLHCLLLDALQRPVIATSGNRASEPICIDEAEALSCLAGIADAFLIHDRPIARPVDDSIVRVVAEVPMLLRRARGYAPLAVCSVQSKRSILAVGAQQKNTIALTIGGNMILSQHLGDLTHLETAQTFQRTIETLETLYDFMPEAIVCDLHPDYFATQYAVQRAGKTIPIVSVQHHHAHVVACMAEHDLQEPVLGVAWDGTGYGRDGTVWGGEFLVATRRDFQRVASLRPFPLLGGEKAVQNPYRVAIALLYEVFGDRLWQQTDLAAVQACSTQEQSMLSVMLKNQFQSPLTSSMGRLFEGVSALLGLGLSNTFEGEAAMALEFAAQAVQTDDRYKLDRSLSDSGIQLDWARMIREILSDIQHQVPTSSIAAKFHNTVAESVVTVAKQIQEWQGIQSVVLSGGCFQNRLLSEKTIHRLRLEKFQVYWPQQVPPNDGGIALGQAIVGLQTIAAKLKSS